MLRHCFVPCLLIAACAHTYIPGTMIRDTAENRGVLEVLGKAKQAMEQRNAEALLTLVAADYFEDMGTPEPNDDYGYNELKDRVLPKSFTVADQIHLSFEVHEVVIEDDDAYADVRYSSRAHLKLPAGAVWDSHQEFNRIHLKRNESSWVIVSGL